MPLPLPPLRLTGALVLRDGQLQDRALSLADGRIARGPLPEVDLSGYLLLPGIVDLHAGAFARHARPRPGLALPPEAALAALDREAAATGVTTAVIPQGWSWEGGHHGPDAALALMAALDAWRPRALTDLHLHLRAEVHLVDEGARLIAAVARHAPAYVVFDDRLEAAREMRRLRPEAFAQRARHLGRTAQDLSVALDAAGARLRDVPRHLCRLAEAFDEMGLLYASHADPDGETRERFAMIGARIAQFPANRPAEILRLADRGRLDPGLRADLVVVNARTRAVEATICGGALTFLAGEAAQRFLSRPQPLRLAAE
jgi:alpha-D-ribose 1-methylphosphonate 5-triphosphate diphosphatase